MIEFIKKGNKALCNGCRNCEKVCPKNCIKLIEDMEGFIYPIVDETMCINCNLCEKVCVYSDEIRHKIFKEEYYLTWTKNEKIRKKSSSGGIIWEISNYIIQNNGCVFGVKFDKYFNVVFDIAYTVEDLNTFHGSKYMSSDVGNIFLKIKDILNNDKLVFFVGLPCQVGALKKYLGRDFDNLITADLICHGVVSNKFFKDYLKYLSNKLKSSIIHFSFRGKNKRAYSPMGLVIETKEKTIRCNSSLSKYFEGFISDKMYRESCYNCQYRYPYRDSDFSIGDFWGAEEYYSDVRPEDGVSLMIINNNKAKDIFDEIKSFIVYKKSDYSKATRQNNAFVKNPDRPSIRDYIYKEIYKDFDKNIRKYLKPSNLFRCFYDSVLSKKSKILLLKLKHKVKKL